MANIPGPTTRLPQKEAMLNARNVLTPDTLSLLQRIADCGSFAAAARQVGMVPSALTYRVRQVEDALDVLLFDRGAGQARLTKAGAELLQEGGRVLSDIDALAQRVKRVATGWEPFFTIAVDGVMARSALMELVESFLALHPPTRLRLRDEVLSGTLGALLAGHADLAIGVGADAALSAGLHFRPMGTMPFLFVVAPHHPLAEMPEPLAAAEVRRHRAVAVADSSPTQAATLGLLRGQDVLTVPTLQAKLDAHLRGLGVGYLPEHMARPHIESGRLVRRQVDQPERCHLFGHAWRKPAAGAPGHALLWWLEKLASPRTHAALFGAGAEQVPAAAAVE